MNIVDLKKVFSGEVILPEDSGYEQGCTTYAGKGAPAVILRPQTAADVAAAICYARVNALVLSVRSGGHHGAGFGTNTGGVVIDLAQMRKIELVDQTARTVRIEPGATWGEVATALQTHGLALSSGDTSSVGVGGLTLGGGMGWMVRQYGLAVDSLVAAEIVTADGDILRVSASEHPDLFWAIRGGGGNFGVVTAFEFTAHPVSKVFAGSITYPTDNLTEILRGWRDHMRTADEKLTSILTLLPSFGGSTPAAMIACCYAGNNEEAAMSAIGPLREFGGMIRHDVKEKYYGEVLEEAHPPVSVKIIVKNVMAETLSDELIKDIAANYGKTDSLILQIRSLGGAMNRIAPDATAFPYRQSEIMMLSPLFVSPEASASEINETLKPWLKIASHGKGAYANFLSSPDEDVPAIYSPETYARLAAVKKTYDPKNLFSQNFNVTPAV